MNFKDMTFPLNVYAALLVKLTGAAEHLHYGHFQMPDEAVNLAQERAVAMLLSHLPDQANILEVGCGFGGLTKILADKGHVVTGVSPDSRQIAIARERYPDQSSSFSCCRLEDFREKEGRWDLLLFHESSQYIPPLDLFERAGALLNPDGQLLILDEFALRRSTLGLENLHYKEYFLALAQRLGYDCTASVDCTAAAAPTLDVLIAGLTRYCSALARETGITETALMQLVQANEEYRKKYQDGRYGYFLLQLQRRGLQQHRLDLIRDKDQPAVSRLFEEVFQQPLSPELWRWKYADGRGQAIGLWKGERLIAHYGGTSRKLLVEGRYLTATQSCDVMVAPQVRGVMGRKGPFFQVCATFLEQYVGYGTRHPLAFGFPNDRAYRLPRLLGLYTDPTTRIQVWRWDAHAFRPRRWRLDKFDINIARDWNDLEQLWKKMSRDLHRLAVGVRDSDYVRQRYLAHPQHRYGLYMIRSRWLGSPLAVVVVKVDGEQLELMDWVGPVAALPMVIAAARLISFRSALDSVYLLASEPVCDSLEATGGRSEDANIVVPENGWTPSPGPAIVNGRLWLTGGDTDFN